MVTLNLNGISSEQDAKVATEFLVARAGAIQAYATLEQSLCLALAHLAGISNDVAATIFFKITAARSRSEILDKLFRKKYQAQHKLFWNSIIKWANQLDQERNSIIHWTTASNIHVSDNGQVLKSLSLIPPNFWDHDENTPSKTTADLNEFSAKCDIISRSLNIFIFSLSEATPENAQHTATWLPIFQQPLTYPLPDTHPLSRNYVAPQNPPQSSQA